MMGSDDNGGSASKPGDTERARTIIVAGQSSQRTRAVLRALRGFTNVIWPTSLESALAQTSSADADWGKEPACHGGHRPQGAG